MVGAEQSFAMQLVNKAEDALQLEQTKTQVVFMKTIAEIQDMMKAMADKMALSEKNAQAAEASKKEAAIAIEAAMKALEEQIGKLGIEITGHKASIAAWQSAHGTLQTNYNNLAVQAAAWRKKVEGLNRMAGR